MHEECAAYAMPVFPFLARPNFGYATHYRKGVNELPVAGKRPERMGIYKTRSFEVISSREATYIKASPAVSVEWWEPGAESSSEPAR